MLKGILEAVVEKMKKYHSLYEENEAAVREHIINPVLNALGWCPENPEEVQPNVSTEEGFPD
ncbi:MAG: hypothetical protein H5T45_01035 [Thermoplasmatales archaeon]|nr:hypothetical protein [Thermoplasmatales archaeon]